LCKTVIDPPLDEMLSREHKLLFARLLFNARDLLFNNEEATEESSTLGQTKKGDRAAKWFEILSQLNSVGADVSDYKNLRDVEWSNLRRAVERKLAAIKANQSKPPDNQQQVKPFTQAEEIVADILGKGSGNTQVVAIDISDYDSLTSATVASTDAGVFKVGYDDDDDDMAGEDLDGGEPAAKKSAAGTTGKSGKKRPILNGGLGSQAELNELRRKKLRLECAKLELELEKIPLECAKLELEIQHLQRTLPTATTTTVEVQHSEVEEKTYVAV